ncbi:hypothetical protein TNCV_2799031 [Trichonephila clavipes]|nr:hypothetical protein TNCV_2799031 [Trichonephila clavipes]
MRQKAESKYRDHIQLEKTSQEKLKDSNKSPYDRVKQCLERKRMNAAGRINYGAISSAAGKMKLCKWIMFNILKDNEERRKQHSRTLIGSFMARREPRVLTLEQS